MESAKELKRARLYRFTAIVISLAIHLGLVIYLMGGFDQTDQPASAETVAIAEILE